VPSEIGLRYLRFTADAVTEFLLLPSRRKTMPYPVCLETVAPMHCDTRPMTLTWQGETITLGMPGWYCDTSGESIHSGRDMKVSERMLNGLRARAEGLPGPEEIRRIRKRLGLPQGEAGVLIGGGKRAFQKYERGDLLPSRAIGSALMLLDHDPEALAMLRRAHRGNGEGGKGSAAGREYRP
jgi:HTH-type transcriptional regulator/antitoxin MqsA